MPVPNGDGAITTDEHLFEIQRQVDSTYKNLLDNFDPATKNVVLSGKQLFKAFLNLNEASKAYVDSLGKLASTGRGRGETDQISVSLSEICNAWKEINRQHEEIISFMGTQVLAPTETNLDNDAKILTEQWKGFQRGQRTIEKRIHSSRKKGIPVNGFSEELMKLKTDGLQKAADEEKKRYLFVLERHVAVVTLYIKLHKQALELLECNVPKWRDALGSDNSNQEAEEARVILDDLEKTLMETPVGTQNVHRAHSNGGDSHSTSASSVSTKKSSSNPSPVPVRREPEDGNHEPKLLLFKPMPDSLKPLMESNLKEEPAGEPVLYKVHDEPPVPRHEASSQTDTIKGKPAEKNMVQNGTKDEDEEPLKERTYPQQQRAAVFHPPPPPPVLPTEIIHHVVVEAIKAADPPIYAVANKPPPVVLSHSSFRPNDPEPLQTFSVTPGPPPLPLSPMPPHPPKEMRRPSAESFVEGFAEAVYPYNANGSHQLSFVEGDSIQVMQDGNLGWQYGENKRTRNRGWFPASFVKSTPSVNHAPAIVHPSPMEERNVKSPVPSQPRHSPDPPPLLRLKQFEPKPQQRTSYANTSPPKFLPKPAKSVSSPQPQPEPVIEPSKPKNDENYIEPSVIVVPKTERPDMHITNFDTIPKNNPFAGVKLRKVLLEEDGKPKKYQ